MLRWYWESPIIVQTLVVPALLTVVIAILLAVNVTLGTYLEATGSDLTRTRQVSSQIDQLYRSVLDMQTGTWGYALTQDRRELEPYLIGSQRATQAIRALGELIRVPDEGVRLERAVVLLENWDTTVATRLIAITEDGQDAAAFIRDGFGQDVFADLVGELQAMVEAQDRIVSTQLANNTRILQFATPFRIVLFSTIAAGLILAFAAGSRVARPIRAMAQASRRVADGDMSVRIPVRGSREGRQVAEAFNAMVASLDAARRELAQRAAEASVRAAEAERVSSTLQAVLDTTSDALLVVDTTGAVMVLNARFVEFFGVTPDQLEGAGLAGMAAMADRYLVEGQALMSGLFGAIDSDETMIRSARQVFPDNRDLEIYSAPVMTGTGKRIGRLYAFRDVTRDREVDRLKSEFVSMVSHELRTPLTSIKGYVDLLADDGDAIDPRQRAEFLRVVQENTTRLMRLIGDLLDLSRIEAGKLQVAAETVELEGVVHGVIQTLAPQAQERGHTVSSSVSPDAHWVLADGTRLAQILTNLLSNAIKYTPEGGQITVSAVRQGSSVRIGVRDTGVGLTPEEQAQLFQRFSRVSRQANQMASGTGLGLAITRSLVELQGGEIGVESAPGRGSEFWFTLPVAPPPEGYGSLPGPGNPREASSAASPQAGRMVLVVDDDQDVRDLITRYLERAGYEVVGAGSAREALRLARALRPDLICLDVLLPDGDGYSVLDQLAGDTTTRGIPVLMVSVLPDEGMARAHGAVGHLSKPVDEPGLVAQVGAVLGGRPQGRILVVDDDPDVRRLVGSILQRAGYEVTEAADGEEAVQQVRERGADVVVMDIVMPRLDGVEALRRLRDDPATATTPVILMSASAGAAGASREEARALGANAVLSKPLTPGQLRDLVARILGAPA